MSIPFDDLWDYDDPAGTEAKLRAAGEAIDATRDPDLYAQLLTQIARTFSLRGQFGEAHALLDEVEANLGPGVEVGRIRLRLERGRTFNSAGETTNAVTCFRAALERAEAGGHVFHAVDAAHMLGIADAIDRRLQWNERAISLAEASTDRRTRRWLGSLLNNTAWTCHEMGSYDRALALFEQCFRFNVEIGRAKEQRIARWCIARTLRSMSRLDEALAAQRALADEAAADPGITEDGFVFEELAECLLALGRPDDARPHFARAADLLGAIEWFARDEAERLERLRGLGRGKG